MKKTAKRITLMSRTEMLRRLKAGERPLKLSIEKWERLRAYLQKHGSTDILCIYDDTCALCEIYDASSTAPCHSSTGRRCPLHARGHCCNRYASPWYNARCAMVKDGKVHWAPEGDAMIAALKACRRKFVPAIETVSEDTSLDSLEQKS